MITGREIVRLTRDDEGYPLRLREIKDPPPVIYCIGDRGLFDRRAVSVVGSRRTTSYGRRTAYAIGGRLAEKGVVTVSGMAAGIDSCAHRGSLDHGGGTIAVLGCGVDMCYPAFNRYLKDVIERRGLVVSEYEPEEGPRRFHFPMRNRIISGLSELTVVVQAGTGSGALITAERAAEQGRDVWAVPGDIDCEFNMGSNKLIQDGAFPVVRIEDIPEALGIRGMDDDEAERLLEGSEMKVYSLLRERGEMKVEEIAHTMNTSSAYICGIVAVMEIKGAVFYQAGKVFIAKP